MISLSSLTESGRILVLDASVIINMNATGCSEAILGCFPGKVVVTTNVAVELAHGRRNGHLDAELLDRLVSQGLVALHHLGPPAEPHYESLISGSARNTLDDGEAATIALAYEVGGVAMIDERKAHRICAERYPSLVVMPSIRLLLDPSVAEILGVARQIQAIKNALELARMRVPQEIIADLQALIGTDEMRRYPSLPRYIGKAGAD